MCIHEDYPAEQKYRKHMFATVYFLQYFDIQLKVALAMLTSDFVAKNSHQY